MSKTMWAVVDEGGILGVFFSEEVAQERIKYYSEVPYVGECHVVKVEVREVE